MKICIISGHYKPNKCGISDYVTLLSTELERQGHDVIKITLSEGHSLVFIAKSLPSADIYSFQFAPYLFSPKGLIGNSLLYLAKSLKDKKNHINFHEIWIGAYPKASMKERLIGWRQKREIIKFLNLTKPYSITCSNAASLDRLKSANIKADYLYLFGNIPFSQSDGKRIKTLIKVAIFGTPYDKFPYDLLFRKLHEFSDIENKRIELKIIGRQRESKGLALIKNLSQKFKCSICECGEQSTESISHEFQSCDLGICTTPYDILGKSGTTAAMLEHGLPVVAFDDGDTTTDKLFVMNEFEEQIFLLNDKSSVTRLTQFMHKQRKPFFDGVVHTAKEMLNLLN